MLLVNFVVIDCQDWTAVISYRSVIVRDCPSSWRGYQSATPSEPWVVQDLNAAQDGRLGEHTLLVNNTHLEAVFLEFSYNHVEVELFIEPGSCRSP